MVRAILQEFFFARFIDRVIKRRSAAILHAMDTVREQLHVIGKILRHLALLVESNYKGFIETGSERVLQKVYSRVLLEVETAMHRSAHVDEQAKMQRQIGFAAKVDNRLRRLVIVENFE